MDFGRREEREALDDGGDGALRGEYQSRVWEGTWRDEKGEQGLEEVGSDEGGDVAGGVVERGG